MREVDKYIFRSVEIAQNRCDPQNILHASAGYGDLALIFCRNVDYLLQSVHIRGKGRNDYALITIFKQHVERLADLAFGGGQTGLFDIGRVAHKREHALVSELTEARQINDLTLYRREVDFKVTCVDYSSDRRFYSQCDSVGYWKDIIAVSAEYEHTVGLKAGGTVVAAGNNSFGQCDVGSWTGIVAVSAGEDHTVALRADGTVVAVGNNDCGQCDVSGWTDIIAVSAGSYNTVGLKSDGTVVAAGSNENNRSNVTGWKDIRLPKAAGNADNDVIEAGTL